MITKRTQHKAGGSRLSKYFTEVGENETVELLDGDPAMLDADDAIAAMEGRKFGLTHFAISPNKEMSNEQWREMEQMIRQEFNIPDDHPSCLVIHTKERADGTKVRHGHLGMGAWTTDGKRIETANFMKRNEKNSRLAEVRFGHEITKGRHNVFAVEGIRGADPAAAAVLDASQITAGKPAFADFSGAAIKRASRLGVDLLAISYALKSEGSKGEILGHLENEQNITFRRGDKRNVIIIEKNGQFIADLRKALSSSNTDEVLSELKSARADAGGNTENDRRGCEKNEGRRRGDALISRSSQSWSGRPDSGIPGKRNDRSKRSDSAHRSSGSENRHADLAVSACAQQRVKAALLRKSARHHAFAASEMSSRASEVGDFATLDINDPQGAMKFIQEWSANEARRLSALKM